MKQISIILLLFSIGILNAQNELAMPPGTIKLNDSLYIDTSPITNIMFEEYLTVKIALDAKGYSSFSQFASDTNEKGFPVMNRINYLSPYLISLYINEPYLIKVGYHRDYLFSDHPVLNVPIELVHDYCRWRTEMVKHLWDNKEEYASNKTLSHKISYRLATKNELIDSFDFFSKSGEAVIFKKKLFKIRKENITREFTVFPVKEMTLSGEVFNDRPPYDYTGFRCVCEIKM
ncbi:hypothetical protein [Gelidibacter mesophilus]|uniref:hypothetical protein n=1 Tax=Gelidibacter mesophilus TaxID=169050 RepID=UPI00041CB25C|nr:hypothetical protein [Gelidibacter mesophilus]